MQTSKTSPAKKVVIGLVLVAGMILGISSTACTATVTVSCGGGLVDCNGECVDTYNDDLNCGGCGLACPGGTYCSNAACITGSCVLDNNPCASHWDCCSDFCATDGNCGCMPSGVATCGADSDCCSNVCDFQTGICN